MDAPLAQVLVGAVLQGGVYFLMSVGLTLIYGVARLVNFAHGALLMWAMYLAFSGLELFAWPLPLAAVAVVGVMTIMGAALYLVGFRQTLESDRAHSAQIVATFGLAVFFEAAALTIWGQDFRSLGTDLAFRMWQVGPVRVSVLHGLVWLVAGVLAAGLVLFLKKSMTGKMIQAVSQDRQAAAVVGIRVERIYVLALMTGLGLVGVSALLMLPLYHVYPSVGHHFNLLAFLTVVIGGMGSIPGAFVGGVVIALVEGLGGYLISPLAGTGLVYLLFIAVLLVRPGGLMGIPEAAQMGE